MTRHQHATINRLRALGYSVTFNRRVRGGSIIATVAARLRHRNIPLRIYPNGQYVCPWYDTHEPLNSRTRQWQTSPS